MKISKKIAVLFMAALLAAVTFIPSTFSWYSHNGSGAYDVMKYQSSNLSISTKSAANTVSVTTKAADADGVESGNALSGGISVPAATDEIPKQIKYYVTTLKNTGANDVFLDLELSNLPNNADVSIGTTFPTVNQKAYASRAARSKTTHNTTRVYFKTNSKWSDFWAVDNGSLDSPRDQNGHQPGGSNTTTNDINIAYLENGQTDETFKKMTLCGTRDSTTADSGTNKVYYYDIPSNAQYFYFFNHWYMRSTDNREWNRTVNITNFTPGTLFYLNGEVFDSKYKDYGTREVDNNLVALMQYYDSVRLSMGSTVSADISLKKESDTDSEEFNPDYYGDSERITYTSSNTSVCTVNSDGLIIPKSSGTAQITTTIYGRYGDSITVRTDVTIPPQIDQYPIAQNIRIPKAGSTDSAGNPTNEVKIEWYVINKDNNAAATADSIFVTM